MDKAVCAEGGLIDGLQVSTPVAPATEEGMHVWRFRRNCSISPGQLLSVFISFAFFSSLIAAFCWSAGARLVIPFTGLEVLAVGVALLVYARHAADLELVSISAQSMVIEWENAGRVERAEFNPRWVRIAFTESGLVEVSESGRCAVIGRHIRPEGREKLARDLRRAILASS